MGLKLDELIKNVNKHFKEDIMFAGNATWDLTKRIPFSSMRANYMLYGGLPRGRVVEFAGENSSGKTTTALDIVANAQKIFEEEAKFSKKEPRKVFYIDTENGLSEDWCKTLGVNLDSIILLKPQSQSAEEIFQIAVEAIETNEIGLMVIDSLGSLLSSAQMEKDLDEQTMGGIAKALTLFMHKIDPLTRKYDCTLLCINQVREVIGNRFLTLTTPGGKAFKHAQAVSIFFQKGHYIDEKGKETKNSYETPMGNIVQMFINKTKICKPNRKSGCYTLNYDTGIDKWNDLLDILLKENLIVQPSDGWFQCLDLKTGLPETIIKKDKQEPVKVYGREKIINRLKTDEELYKRYSECVDHIIKGENFVFCNNSTNLESATNSATSSNTNDLINKTEEKTNEK